MQDSRANTLSVIGSTMRSDGSARLFKVDVPRIDCFFSGTGDMFAALTVARLREEVFASSNSATTPPLHQTASWVSPDNVVATQLPIAKATEKVLASMHAILLKTMLARNEELAKYPVDADGNQEENAVFAKMPEAERKAAVEKRAHLRQAKAAEIRLVRNVELLRNPVVEYFAEEWCE